MRTGLVLVAFFAWVAAIVGVFVVVGLGVIHGIAALYGTDPRVLRAIGLGVLAIVIGGAAYYCVRAD